MTAATRKAIVALMAVDETATADERERVAAALAGRMCEVLTVAEVARRLRVSRMTVYAMSRRGHLARLQDGRISARSVEQYLEGQRPVDARRG